MMMWLGLEDWWLWWAVCLGAAALIVKFICWLKPWVDEYPEIDD